MTGQVINLGDRRPPEMPADGWDGYRCMRCGSVWFSVTAACLNDEMSVTGWAGPLTCRDCGNIA